MEHWGPNHMIHDFPSSEMGIKLGGFMMILIWSYAGQGRPLGQRCLNLSAWVTFDEQWILSLLLLFFNIYFFNVRVGEIRIIIFIKYVCQ